jgi:hypothetical protein
MLFEKLHYFQRNVVNDTDFSSSKAKPIHNKLRIYFFKVH